MPIAETIAAVSGVIAVGKQVKAAGDAYGDAELKLQVADLVSRLVDLQLALADTQKEIETKDAEIVRLTEAFQLREDTKEVDGLLYRVNSEGEPKGRPYCPNCLAQGLPILIQKSGHQRMDNSCPTCKTRYTAAENLR